MIGVLIMLCPLSLFVLLRWSNGNREKDLFPQGYATGAWGSFCDMVTGTHISRAEPSRVKDLGGGNGHFDNYNYMDCEPSLLCVQ